MPELSTTGRILAGVAGQPTTVDGVPLGHGAQGDGGFLDPNLVVVQQCREGLGPNGEYACDGVIVDATGALVRQLHSGGVDDGRLRAGGGRAIVAGASTVIDTTGPPMPGRFPMAMGDDGLAADIGYPDPTPIRFTRQGGQTVGTLDVPTLSNGNNYRAFLRDGFFTHATPSGWQVYNVTSMPPAIVDAFRPWPTSISWMVPLVFRGELWLLERHDLYLTVRPANATMGYIVARYGGIHAELHNPDGRVIGDAIHVVHSDNQGENWEAVRFGVFTWERLQTVDYITFEAPTSPVTPGAPPIDPPPTLETCDTRVATKPLYYANGDIKLTLRVPKGAIPNPVRGQIIRIVT